MLLSLCLYQPLPAPYSMELYTFLTGVFHGERVVAKGLKDRRTWVEIFRLAEWSFAEQYISKQTLIVIPGCSGREDASDGGGLQSAVSRRWRGNREKERVGSTLRERGGWTSQATPINSFNCADESNATDWNFSSFVHLCPCSSSLFSFSLSLSLSLCLSSLLALDLSSRTNYHEFSGPVNRRGFATSLRKGPVTRVQGERGQRERERERASTGGWQPLEPRVARPDLHAALDSRVLQRPEVEEAFIKR